MSLPLEILFEDDYIVVLNKPPKMLVIQDRFNKLEPNLQDILKNKYPEIFTIHRLDKETSGVIIFAKRTDTHKELSVQFEKHKVQKIYSALLQGVLSQENGIIDAPLSKKNSHENVMVVDRKNGKHSITHFESVKKFKNYTLVNAFPKTGRTHQIRVHFKSIGHPLAIDKLYGTKEKFFLSDIKTKFTKSNEEKALMDRLTLHASSIEFTHPNTFTRMKIEAPYHKDFKALIKNLEKYGF
jgi:23S rRNA pseudouridine955/2504/2580 synthase/23S rRNA pseudouridine1911/1915/1917 synthase